MDLYILLGVSRAATLDDIKRAYRRLARKYHPDINPGDRAAALQFRQIAEAYETLSDPDRRRRYDAGGVAVEPPDRPAYGFEGFDFSVSVSGESATNFGDLFADVIHQQIEAVRGAMGDRGADLHATIRLPFEAAMRGGPQPVTVTRQEHCGVCRGRGYLPGEQRTCSPCHGSGIVKSARNHMVFSKPCPSCGGTGLLADTRCPACHGRQMDTRVETLSVHVPAGVPDGGRIRVAAKGQAGANGGPYGDLYVTVAVEPHPVFQRQGDDLLVVVPIAIDEAALGGRVEVPSLDGTTKVRVPPGTQSGQRFRVREGGVPSPRDGRRGDLIVEVRLTLPKSLDERSKDLLREFGRINPAAAIRTEPLS